MSQKSCTSNMTINESLFKMTIQSLKLIDVTLLSFIESFVNYEVAVLCGLNSSKNQLVLLLIVAFISILFK